MTIDNLSIRSVKNVSVLDVEFTFPESSIIVITGKNGIGKTTIVESFGLLSDPDVFAKSSGEDTLSNDSQVLFSISGFEPFAFYYNSMLHAFDTKDSLPHEDEIVSELPIPYGARFQRFSKIAKFDSELKFNIASTDYEKASELIDFLSSVYSSRKFESLKSTKIKKDEFYFILKRGDYYIREDHFSSGEFFLIQLYRLLISGAKLILIDELDVALDGVAQANLYSAIKPILQEKNSRLIVISHSLAFMNTVDEGGLYYLEEDSGGVSLEARSIGYIKSDLFGFRGYDRYILTEDSVLEGFIEFLIRYFSIDCHYRHITIGVAGVNQLQKIVEKNDSRQIFSASNKVICIVDADVFSKLKSAYRGPTRIISSLVKDIELFIYLNREHLFCDVELPSYPESEKPKKAAKSYWKWLTIDKKIGTDRLYRPVVESNRERAEKLREEIQRFLGR